MKVLIPLFYELAWLGYKPPLLRHTPDHVEANAATLHREGPVTPPKGPLSDHSRPGIFYLHLRRSRCKSSGHKFISTCRGYPI